LSPRRLTLLLWLAALLAAVPLLTAGTAGAEIAPPWCGTPEPDAAANLPASRPGAFPHIPYYAIGCTLDAIAARSDGRMKVERHGVSARGRQMYRVTINELETKAQRRAYSNWQKIRRYSRSDPRRAQSLLRRAGDDVKVALYVQGGIHGNEYEGVDASMQIIERLATTPYGTDPEVDQILDQAIIIFNPIQNPDGRIAGTRANGNGFDLNRDFLTQSQSETQASVETMQKWLPPETLDLHGYVEPTLIEATTKPHNPGIEYDLWLKWNQSRIDANESAMNAEGFLVTRPINDWCDDGDIPVGGLCPLEPGEPAEFATRWGPKWAESWDDWGPFYTPMYSQLVGLNGSTVEMCDEFEPFPNDDSLNTECGPLVSETEKIGASGARRSQYITVWSSLLFDTDNRVDLMHDQLEIYLRGENDAPRPPLSSFPDHPTDQSRQFRNEENYWMVEYPKAYVVPLGEDQRSDVEAVRLVRWLLDNGIEVHRMRGGGDDDDDDDDDGGSSRHRQDGYVVWMDQPHRGLAFTSLDVGLNVSDRIGVLYAPPGAWSHGELWGADVVRIEDSASFNPKTRRITKIRTPEGDVEGRRNALSFALELDSPTAVRTLNELLADGLTAELATTPFTNVFGDQLAAGTVLFPASARDELEDVAEDTGLNFTGVRGPLPAREPIDRSPRIAALANALTQEIWVLRELGFTADPISTAALNNAAGPDPLANYDVIFNLSNLPGGANATYRSRVASFFAAGGGYIGGGQGGANYLGPATATPSPGIGQVSGLTALIRQVRGWSGIIRWANSASGTGQITGAYPTEDRAIVDPPTWFTSVPAGWTVDGSLPMTGFFLSGLWKLDDGMSPSAPGAAVIAHGTNTAGTARIASFAMNPAYRADPEREWPMLASAALWADQ
jgi:Zinc carboxypeptidase